MTPHMPDGTLARQLTARLSFRYGIVLVVLALLSLSAYLVLEAVISDNSDMGATINVAGRQRMLSQRIALFAERLPQTRDDAERRAVQEQLAQAINLMERSHQGLLFGDGAMGLDGTLSPAIRSVYFGPRGLLDRDVRVFLDSARAVLNAPIDELEGEDLNLHFLRLAASEPLLESLDRVVAMFQHEAEERVAHLHRIQIFALALTLFLLVLSAFGVFQPMVRLIQSEMARQVASRRRLAGILASANDGIITIDEWGRVESFNRAAERMFGYSADEVEGRNVNMLMPSPYAEEHDHYIRRFIATGKSRIIGVGAEVTARRKDGSLFPIELNISELRLDDKRLFTGIVRDITDRKRAEEQLNLAAIVFDHSLHAITVTDAETRILDVNPAFTKTTGYRRDEAVGQTPRLLSSGRHDGDFYHDMWKALMDSGHWEGEIWNRRKNGQVYPQYLEINAVRDREGRVSNYVGFFTDITKIKVADEKLSAYAGELEVRNVELRDALIKANEANRAKSEFLATMSHELRTPLNAIIGFSEAMIMGVFGRIDNPRYGEYLDSIHDSGRHLLKVINDILDVSKVEAGKLDLAESAVDVREAIEASVRLVEPRAQDGDVLVKIAPLGTPPALHADERRVKQILLNLLSNAVKFTPSGGLVTISAGLTAEGELVITVSDTGIGIDAKDIPKVMSPFGQADSKLSRKFEGTGLGLPLTKGLIELHDGRLEMNSRLGEGTRVSVYFPAARIIRTPEERSPDARSAE